MDKVLHSNDERKILKEQEDTEDSEYGEYGEYGEDCGYCEELR